MKHIQCSCLTRKKAPCPFNADRVFEGKPVCHVHDPNGTAAKNRYKSQTPTKPSSARAPFTPTQSVEYTPGASTPPLSALQAELAAIGKAQTMMAQRLEAIERRLDAMHT